jgi:single-strand DNA-binding protein
MNQVTISGYVGQAPKAVSFNTGNKVVKFSVAVKEYSSNSDQPTTLWMDVDAWNGLGERVLKCITKGREVIITGRLALSTFERVQADGTLHKMSKPVIKLTAFDLCGKKLEVEMKTPAGKATTKAKPMALASA